MTHFTIIHQSPHHHRYVVFIPEEQKLFKIQPSSLQFIDTEIKAFLPNTDRFCFWDPIHNDSLNIR